MQNPTEKEITNRAYQLWEQAGKPEGRDKEFYHQAEQELRNEDKSSPLRTPESHTLKAMAKDKEGVSKIAVRPARLA
jgi:hypothetical protein